MGLFAGLQNIASNPFSVSSNLRNEVMGGNAAREAANEIVDASRQAGALQREFGEIIRDDGEELRENRNRQLIQLGDTIKGEGDFRNSSDYKVVRDGAMSAVDPEGFAADALKDRAEQIGLAQFSPYRNRVATEAGISSGGLNTTNSLLQQNTNDQVALLNTAGQIAGDAIRGHSQQNAQTATGLMSLFV